MHSASGPIFPSSADESSSVFSSLISSSILSSKECRKGDGKGNEKIKLKRPKEVLAPVPLPSTEGGNQKKCRLNSDIIAQVDNAIKKERVTGRRDSVSSSATTNLTTGDTKEVKRMTKVIQEKCKQKQKKEKVIPEEASVSNNGNRYSARVPSTNFSCPFVRNPKFKPQWCNIPLNFENKRNTIRYPDFKTNRYKMNNDPRLFYEEFEYLESRKAAMTCAWGTAFTVEEGSKGQTGDGTSEESDTESEFEVANDEDEDEVPPACIDLKSQDNYEAWKNVDLMGVVCERMTAARAFLEHTGSGTSFPVDQANSGVDQLIQKNIDQVIRNQSHKNDPELTLLVAKTISLKIFDSACRNYDNSQLFVLLIKHLFYAKNHVQAIKIFSLFENCFAWKAPWQEHIRYEKARYMLNHNLFDETLMKSLHATLTQKVPARLVSEGDLQEKQIWTARLCCISATLLYKRILFKENIKSLSFDASNLERDLSVYNTDCEMAVELFEKFLFEVSEHSELYDDIGSYAGLLPYYVDLKCQIDQKDGARTVLKRLFPEELPIARKLIKALTKNRTFSVPEHPFCSVQEKFGFIYDNEETKTEVESSNSTEEF